jgi:hypothetical protein
MDYILERLEKAAELEKIGNWREVLAHSKEWAAAEPHNLFAWQGIGDSLTELGMVGRSNSSISQRTGGGPSSSS